MSSRCNFANCFVVNQIYKYRPIDELVCTSGQPTEEELDAIAGEGFQAIINLGLHNDPRYSLRNEPAIVQSLGMEYVHIPVQFSAPTENDLLIFFAAMEKHEGKKMLIHCAANFQASTFLGLYRAIKQRVSFGEAFGLMNSVWEPNATWSFFISSMLAKYCACV